MKYFISLCVFLYTVQLVCPACLPAEWAGFANFPVTDPEQVEAIYTAIYARTQRQQELVDNITRSILEALAAVGLTDITVVYPEPIFGVTTLAPNNRRRRDALEETMPFAFPFLAKVQVSVVSRVREIREAELMETLNSVKSQLERRSDDF